jgi:O-antigen/teichoic acid export membrane protein
MTKVNKLSKLFKNHVSLIIMALGAISIFSANIVFKSILTGEEYGLYSIIIIYISLLSSFGLLGLDQVLIRTAILKEIVILDGRLLRSIFTVILITSFLFSIILHFEYFNNTYYMVLVALSFLTSAIMLLFNLFRLSSNFSAAQIINNLWKILLGLSIIIIIFLDIELQINSLIFLFVLFQFLTLVFCAVYLILKINIKIQSFLTFNNILKLAFGFFISLLTISILNQGDRILIERKLGLNELGDFFFLANVFLFPFSFLQSYIGFKEMVYFKLKINLKLLNKKILFSIFTGLILAITISIGGLILDRFFNSSIICKSNLDIIIILILIGIIKLAYSILSSGMGAVADVKEIKASNIKFSISILIIWPILYFLGVTVVHFLIGYLILWLIRSLIWYSTLHQKIKLNEI